MFLSLVAYLKNLQSLIHILTWTEEFRNQLKHVSQRFLLFSPFN